MAKKCPNCGEKAMEIAETKAVPGLTKKDGGMLAVLYRCTNCDYEGRPAA